MSISTYGMVEFRYPGEHRCDWWAGCKAFFYGNTHVTAVLAHPWGEWEDDGDLPQPVVKPRGLPEDVSLMVLHETHRTIGKRDKDGFERTCTAKEAKKYREAYVKGYYLDPNEWRCATWLTTDEVAEAGVAYIRSMKSNRGAPEIESILGFMRAFEMSGPVGTKCRLVLWYQ